MPVDQDGAALEADLVLSLGERIDAIEDMLRTTTAVVDEKALKELRRTIEALAKRDPKFEERVTNKVDVLADRVETVAKTVSTASASVAAKEGEIVQLRRELEAGLARINTAILEAKPGTDPSELADIRRTLDDLSKLTKQRMPRGLESRVDELADKFALISQRVDSVASTVSTTASGLAGRDGDVNALRRTFEAERDRTGAELAELRRGIDASAVSDLRQALKELADETARRLHGAQNFIGQAGAKIDALTDTVNSVATSLESTASTASGAEQGLSTFRAYFDDARERLNALLAEHRQTLVALSERATALEQAEAAGARAVEDRLVDVSQKLDHLAGRLESSERTSADTARRLDERISDASTVTDDFVGQLEPLKAAVTSATERLEAREGALQAMEHRFHDATTRVDDLVAELSRALAELPDPNNIDPALAARIDEVAERTVSLTEAIDRVEASLREQRRTSASSAADVERLHEELSTVRGQFDDAGEGFSSLVAQQQQLLSEIGARTTALEQSEGNVPRELDDRVMDLRDKLEALAHRLELSTTAVTSTAAMASTTDEEVSALRDYVDKAGARLSALVAEQTRALSALDTRTESLEQADSHVLSSVDERLSTTSDRIDELSSRLDPLVARARDELEGRIEELDARLGSADDDRTETASEVARIAAILEVERAAVRTKLDALAAALEKTPPATEADELGQRIDDLVSRFEALDGERASSQTQFEAIANALASIPQHFSFEQRLDELGRRLDEVEQRGATVTTKVSQPSALLPAALRSLEARLDEVSPGIRGSVQEPEAPSTQTTPDDEPETTETVELVDRETAAVVPLRVREP